MGVKFFGQFLIEQGEVDADQLCQALELMNDHNKQLGEIAVEKGYLLQSESDWINLRQRTTDQSFGELAEQVGMTSREQLDEVVELQRTTRLQIGEALVTLECIAEDKLPTLLDQFKVDQAPYEVQNRSLNPELDDNPVAHLVLNLLPKFCMRMAKVPVKMGVGRPLGESTSHAFKVGLAMHGPPNLEVTLLSDDTFSRHLAASVSGMNPDRLTDELVADGVGEFLNVLCGNAVAALERDGILVTLDPPVCNIAPQTGIAFDLTVGDGCASVVLAST